MIAVSLGFIAASIILATGTALISEGIWLGIIPLIIGYEIARWVILFLLKTQWGVLK